MYSSTNEAAAESDETATDLFMPEFKYFKNTKFPGEQNLLSQNPARLINLQGLTSESAEDHHLKRVQPDNIDLKDWACGECLRPLNEWSIYEFEDPAYQGFYLISNPFRGGHQRYFIKKCLGEYHCLPNKTNLDLHMNRTDQNLWDQAIKNKDFSEFNKLRWTTVGYHYDWTEKIYRKEDFNPVPKDVCDLTKLIARALSFKSFEPEAGIINYYHLNSTLSAHTDHSEENMDAPLISISLGSSAIFLLGSHTKSTCPKAVFLKSGDVCIMSGKSRLAYHGVPKILRNEHLDAYFDYDDDDTDSSAYRVPDDEWRQYKEYIAINRINLNIRQVYFK